MLSSILCTMVLWFGSNNVSLVFKPEIIYQVPSEEAAVLEDPADVTFDEKGNLYILDSSGKSILVWDPEGRFVKSIGREGDGPGEFRFEDPVRSELTYDGEHIVVWDDKAGKIQYFKNMEYVKTRNKPVGLGSVPVFECLKNGNAIMWLQQRRNGVLHSRIILVDSTTLEEIKVLSEMKDEMYQRNEKGGWDFYPYSKKPIIHADYFSDRIYVGNAVDSEIAIYQIDGEELGELQMSLPPREHTPADRFNIMKHYSWLKAPNKPIFSDYKRLYDTIVPISANQVLVSPYDMDEGFYNGHVYDSESSRVLGGFKQFFGEQGGIYYSNSQIIAFYNDESGNYSIKLLKASLQPD